jgi:hypothetical protein
MRHCKIRPDLYFISEVKQAHVNIWVNYCFILRHLKNSGLDC